MRAHAGDHLTIKGHRVGEAERSGEILEVRGENGEPPFLVRWADGHEAWLYPGPDAVIEKGRARASKSKKG